MSTFRRTSDQVPDLIVEDEMGDLPYDVFDFTQSVIPTLEDAMREKGLHCIYIYIYIYIYVCVCVCVCACVCV